MRFFLALFLALTLQGCVVSGAVETELLTFSGTYQLDEPTRAWASPDASKVYLEAKRVTSLSDDWNLLWGASSVVTKRPDQVAVYDVSGRGQVERLVPARCFVPPRGSKELPLGHDEELGLFVEVAGARLPLSTTVKRLCRPAQVVWCVVLPFTLTIDLALAPVELVALLVVLGGRS
jgi:hypothetical protein